MGPGNEKIIELRRALAERYPQAAPPGRAARKIPVGALERVLPEGIPHGVLVECVCAALSCGGTSLLHAWAASAAERGWVALVDGADTFDAAALPGRVPRLIWARCREAGAAMKAADLLLRDGNFAWVLLDLRDNAEGELRRIGGAAWYRFQRLAEATGVGLAVFTRSARVPSAAVRVEVRAGWGLEAVGWRREEILGSLQTKAWRRGRAVGAA